MKIENEEQPILKLHSHFELDRSVKVRTGAETYIDQPENGF
jgi:hypothetical protein